MFGFASSQKQSVVGSASWYDWDGSTDGDWITLSISAQSQFLRNTTTSIFENQLVTGYTKNSTRMQFNFIESNGLSLSSRTVFEVSGNQTHMISLGSAGITPKLWAGTCVNNIRVAYYLQTTVSGLSVFSRINVPVSNNDALNRDYAINSFSDIMVYGVRTSFIGQGFFNGSTIQTRAINVGSTHQADNNISINPIPVSGSNEYIALSMARNGGTATNSWNLRTVRVDKSNSLLNASNSYSNPNGRITALHHIKPLDENRWFIAGDLNQANARPSVTVVSAKTGINVATTLTLDSDDTSTVNFEKINDNLQFVIWRNNSTNKVFGQVVEVSDLTLTPLNDPVELYDGNTPTVQRISCAKLNDNHLAVIMRMSNSNLLGKVINNVV